MPIFNQSMLSKKVLTTIFYRNLLDLRDCSGHPSQHRHLPVSGAGHSRFHRYQTPRSHRRLQGTRRPPFLSLNLQE